MCMHVEISEDSERTARCRVHESTQHIPDTAAHGEGNGKDKVHC